MSHSIELPAVLTADTVVAIRSTLLQAMQAQPSGAVLVLDASKVQSFDSAGLALLLACRREAQAREQVLGVQGWTDSLRSLAQVYGVMPLLDPQAAADAVA